MMLKVLVIAVQFLVGLFGMLKERSWRALGAFFAGFALFWSIARVMTCARCDNYGKDCYSLYLGKVTSKYLPKMDGEIGPMSMGIEALALGLINNSPTVGLWRNRRLLAAYQLLSTATLVMHFSHSCRHCAHHATDWRKDCPSAKVARVFFGAGPEIPW